MLYEAYFQKGRYKDWSSSTNRPKSLVSVQGLEHQLDQYILWKTTNNMAFENMLVAIIKLKQHKHKRYSFVTKNSTSV
jgi:hypothetical protein